MTPQQLQTRLADCNLLPFHQIHLTRAGRLSVKGAALQAAVIEYRAQSSLGASPALDAAQDALEAAQADMQAELDELAGVSETARSVDPKT